MVMAVGRKYAFTARIISPAIPADPTFRRELEEDLTAIGCAGLIVRPWSVKSEELIQELLIGTPNQYELTKRGRAVTWTEDVWAEVYSFPTTGSRLASRTNKYTAGKFKHRAHQKEDYAFSDCREERHQRLLEFLISH